MLWGYQIQQYVNMMYHDQAGFILGMQAWISNKKIINVKGYKGDKW